MIVMLCVFVQAFELLCPQGGKRPITAWQECNWGPVPAHAVMTVSDKTPQQKARMKGVLLEAQKHFTSPGQTGIFEDVLCQQKLPVFKTFFNNPICLYRNNPLSTKITYF